MRKALINRRISDYLRWMSGKTGRIPDGRRVLRELSGKTGRIPDGTRVLRELSGKC